MIVAYTALHYGVEYLEWAIRSVIGCVDEYHILYSGLGSHGHRVKERPPDKKVDLYDAARRAAGRKLRWHDGVWTYEGQQRDHIYAYAPKADCVLVLDADEVWGDGLAAMALEVSSKGTARDWHVPIIHYWRSFHRCVLHDPAFPVRLIYPTRAKTAPSRTTATSTSSTISAMPRTRRRCAINCSCMATRMRSRTHGIMRYS